MVRKIIWAKAAELHQKEILEFWNERNKSKRYSRKLSQLFRNSIKVIQTHPFAGKKSQLENIRLRVVRDYLIVYEIKEESIIILMIWDTRRNPDNLSEYLKK